MEKFIGGLLPLPKDKKDFSFGSVFGSADLAELPLEFRIGTPLQIKNQFNSDMCTAFGSSSVSEDQEGVLLSPEYIFAKTKQIAGELYN